jgi:hypothetical protein
MLSIQLKEEEEEVAFLADLLGVVLCCWRALAILLAARY